MLSNCVSLLVLIVFTGCVVGRYKPTWESLDSRPLPPWYDEAKLGIFIHWGVFAVPSFGGGKKGTLSEWFWWNWKGRNVPEVVEFMKNNYPPDFQYADFAPEFTAEFFDPFEWADILKSSGAKYVVLTSKHHEGYTNWPSEVSWNWNSMDVGPKRDIVGELAHAVRERTDLHFGLYHSLFEWFNSLYLADKKVSFQTNAFVRKKTMPELYDIVTKYKPDVVWSDGQWEATAEYWNSTNFLAWLYNDSPVKDTVVTNDRWGKFAICKHGGFLTCRDRYNPGVLQKRKWENSMTIEKKSWGFRRNANLDDYFTIEQLIQTFVKTISCGGNMLMNVGPTKEGTISPIYQERLKQMGEWLGAVGEAVYGTTHWNYQNDLITKGVWYTAKGKIAYAFFFEWPDDGYLFLGSPVPCKAVPSVSLLGLSGELSWAYLRPGIEIDLKNILPSKLPSKWVWVVKLTGFE